MKKPLNRFEVLAYDFMRSYFLANDMLPSSIAIADRMQISQTTANVYQRALKAKGWLERNAAGKYRFAREGVAA